MHTSDQLPTSSFFVKRILGTHRTRGEKKDILSFTEELKSYTGKDLCSLLRLGKNPNFSWLKLNSSPWLIPFSEESNLGNKFHREMSLNIRDERIDHCHLKRSYSAPSAHSTNGQKYNSYGAISLSYFLH